MKCDCTLSAKVWHYLVILVGENRLEHVHQVFRPLRNANEEWENSHMWSSDSRLGKNTIVHLIYV